MSTRPIRWLHLSDFHVGLDNYGQRKMFNQIIEHVLEMGRKGISPDVVFFDG